VDNLQHVESDECGSLDQWLAAAPEATAAHGVIGCNTWLNHSALRQPRPLADQEVLDLGGKVVRHLDTPHVPHSWDAGLIFEETTRTLFSSDLLFQFGDTPPLASDILARLRLLRRRDFAPRRSPRRLPRWCVASRRSNRRRS
jgi:flavorubredoxin